MLYLWVASWPPIYRLIMKSFTIRLIAALAAFAVALSCEPEPVPDDSEDKEQTQTPEPDPDPDPDPEPEPDGEPESLSDYGTLSLTGNTLMQVLQTV